MADDILKELLKLETLAGPSRSSSSSKGKSAQSLNATLASLEESIELAERQIRDGVDPESVLASLVKQTEKGKGDVEKGLKEWYGGLSKVGKAIDKGVPSELGAISKTYDLPEPPLFSDEESSTALHHAILETMIRKGAWEAAEVLCRETEIDYDREMQRLSVQLHETVADLDRGDVDSALKWSIKHHTFLSSPPHPSPLTFHLHRARYIHLLRNQNTSLSPSHGPPALSYARDHLFPYLSSHHAEVLHLTGALAYQSEDLSTSPYAYLLSPDLEAAAIIPLFTVEFCRLHGWPKDDPLGVVVELGAGGALNKIEKARKVMKERMGEVRTWDELPIELPLPQTRRYHSVFACPVSKEQATEANPPKMLACGHVIAQDSLTKLSKHGRKAVKCPYCPVETAISSAMRLYF